MGLTSASWLMKASVSFYLSAFPVHVPRPRPIGEAVVGTIFVAPFRRRVEEPVDAEKFFAATTER